MKHMRTIPVPATTRDVVESVTCDLCGTRIVKDWCELDEVEVSHKTGYDAGDSGGNTVETSFDICGKCFDGKLVPWLRSQGAVPGTTSLEW